MVMVGGGGSGECGAKKRGGYEVGHPFKAHLVVDGPLGGGKNSKASVGEHGQ